MKKIRSLPVIGCLFIVILFFFLSVFVHGKLPLPSDTIIGLYHPFRDLYALDYPNGIPYKNALITDPVRQQYPWKSLSVSLEKQGLLPLWNPYNFGGTPLLATFQAGVFYPVNILFFLLPFASAWSVFIFLQPLLAGIFLYLYLRNFSLHPLACLLGALSFAFCGFSIAWLEWGNIVQAGLWLPLILLSIDKVCLGSRKIFFWSFLLLFSFMSSFFAGHLQIFFYIAILSCMYFFVRWWQFKKSKKFFGYFLLFIVVFLSLTAIQWIPSLQFIQQSARSLDQVAWQQVEGWFIPWRHLVQFIAPDFFGNPTTLNYWGTWNYGELVGYIGIVPLLFALFAITTRRDKKVLFFSALLFISLLFALPTWFAQFPYQLQIPFLSTSQPTRLLFVVDFSLAVLAALGADWFLRTKKKKLIAFSILFLGVLFIGLWIFAFSGAGENVLVAKRNLYMPTVFFGVSVLFFVLALFFNNKKAQILLLCFLVILTAGDLIRFIQKFTPFTSSAYLFPTTKSLTFLQNNFGSSRIMTTDSRILPPNFSIMYQLQSVDGYDPLYLLRYGELIAASERGKPDITSPFGFHRIITPHNADSRIMDLLGVKYILSLSDLPKERFTKVFEEGQTKVYENPRALPRAFFIQEIISTNNKQQTINALFDQKNDLRKTAIVEGWDQSISHFASGSARIISYTPNKIMIETENEAEGFLVLTDAFYPTWHATICQKSNHCLETKIYVSDYALRGIIVPGGKHTINFLVTLF